METMTAKQITKQASSAAENIYESKWSTGADDVLSSFPRGSRSQRNAAQLLGLADDCDGSDAAVAGGGKTIIPKKMRIKRRHEDHELHKTKRRLTEILATVHEDEDEISAECQPAVKLHAVKQQSADDVTMHRRLQCEYLKLQKHFAAVQSLLAETSSRHAKQVSDLEDELRDTRERHDLIEFQLLEIEQCQRKGIGKVVEKGVNTFLEGRCCQYGYLLEELVLKRVTTRPMEKVDGDSNAEKQSDETHEETCDHSNKIDNIDTTQTEVREKMSLEKPHKELVTRNLKLYIEELQKSVLKKDNPMCSNTESANHRDDVESHCTSAASEDEGLGEDSRRDESTGPNSFNLDAEEEYQGHFDGVIVDIRKRETSLVSQLCQADARISELQDRLNVKEEQVLKLLSESCNYAMIQEQLSITELKRSELQEQVLELEEAENDSRSEAQRLQMVVLNMEERERLLEDEIHRARIELEKCECRLRGMEITDRELQSQISYTEALVCKYEKHIGELESAETNLHQKIVQLEHHLRMARKSGKADMKSSLSQTLNTSHSRTGDVDVQVEDKHTQTATNSPQDQVSLLAGCKDSLIFRLKQLEEKDGVLREQLHQMDGINLMLWQKLHSLDSNIERCKKQERRNYSDESKHQIASARLDDLLTNPPSKKPENPTVIENLTNSLEGSELKNHLAQLEKEHYVMRNDFEAKTIENNEIIQRMEKEKMDVEQELEKMQKEKNQLEETSLNTFELRDSCAKCQHFSFAISQLRDDEVMLRSDITQHQVQVEEMCLQFQKKLKDLADAHLQKEEFFKNENAILREKEREYQEELQSLRETRKSLKSEIGAMIREKNAVLYELRNKLIALEDKKNLPNQAPTVNTISIKYCDQYVQTDNEQCQLKKEQLTEVHVLEATLQQSDEEDNYEMCLDEIPVNQNEDVQSENKSIYETVCTQSEIETEINTNVKLTNPENTTDLLFAIQQLRERGQSMERRIDELQQKESAYIETLENADKIISNLERGYQEKIVQLESSEKNLRQRIVELEESENQLRGMVYQPERRSSADGWRISDLVKELTEAEARENAMKEHSDEVEASHRTLLQRLRELEKSNQQFQEEGQEQEELLGTMRKKERELKEELIRVQQSESALRLTLHQADQILAQRERGVLEQVEHLETEKRQLEETVEGLRDEMAMLKVNKDRLNDNAVVTMDQLEQKEEKRPPVSFEDLSVGLDARMELEECMTRAMAAMERDMERKSSMDERENIRSSDSTSGCESDCSSTYIWPNSEDSDSDHAVDEPRPKKMLITSSENTATVPTRINYPTGTFTRLDKKSKVMHNKNAQSLTGDKDMESKVKTYKKANQDSTNQLIGSLLPPENFIILRQVGKDSLLVGWKPRVSKSASISYQIFVDGQLQQNIRSPDRTKALLHKLDLSVPLNISIQSVTAEGDVSEPTCALFMASTQSSLPSVKV